MMARACVAVPLCPTFLNRFDVLATNTTCLFICHTPQETVHAIVWVGDCVFLATPSGYKLARGGKGVAPATITEVAPNPGVCFHM